MVEAVLKVGGLKGLILETFGAGNTPGGPDSALTRVLAEAVQRGIVIVNVTQCLSGSVSPLYASGTTLNRAGVVFGHDMTTEAALTKLSYLLSLEDATPLEVAKQMGESLCGELTELSRTLFHHPSGALTPERTNLLALGYAVRDGDLQVAKDVMRGESRYLLNDADPYSGNTPLVSRHTRLWQTIRNSLAVQVTWISDMITSISRPQVPMSRYSTTFLNRELPFI
jgi:lysophospholipase